jgi:hypothetical protein
MANAADWIDLLYAGLKPPAPQDEPAKPGAGPSKPVAPSAGRRKRPAATAAVLAGAAAGPPRAWSQEAPHTAAAMLHNIPAEQRLTPARVILHALPEFKIVFIGLLAAMVAAIAVWAVQQVRLRGSQPPSPEGGLAFLSALAATAPLLGATIAAYDLLKVCLGLVNMRPTPDLVMIAPAFAEAAMAVFLGLLAAAVASAARGHLLMSVVRAAGAPSRRP